MSFQKIYGRQPNTASKETQGNGIFQEMVCASNSKAILSYYLANKKSIHIRSQGLEIPTLIEQKNKNYPPLPLW